MSFEGKELGAKGFEYKELWGQKALEPRDFGGK